MAETYENEAEQDDADGAKPAEKAKRNERILRDSLDALKICIDDESIEREKMRDDLRFCTLDQWPAEIRRSRENDPNGARPCLTSDEINQYIVQVENDMRHNRPSIKPRPVDDKSDPATAEIFAGLIRHIEDQSNATVAYVTGGGSAVRVGLGYFRVTTEILPGTFNDQEPRIVRIPNTFSVYLNSHIQPDGSDATKGWILEEMSLEKFKREFPKAKHAQEDFAGLGITPTWRTEDSVMVAEHFYIEYKKTKLLFLNDGRSVYADEYDGPQANIADSRDEQKQSVKWVKHTGCEILQEREWLGKYIPIIEVVGKESYVDGERVLWGLVRPAKDMLRMKNYWLSAATEKIALSPKVPFIGAKGQFENLEEQWKRANVENRAYLEYNAIDVNGNAIPRPERVAPAPVEMAIVNMLGMIEHDVQKSLGMFKASVGEAESQQSGKAILALQRESDTGTFHFQDNLSLSIQYCGRILIDLIPKVIDTKRVLRILGEDGKSSAVMVDPSQQQAKREVVDSAGNIKKIYNLGVGTYDVTVATGPSYSTGRQEAATILTDLANSAKDPASAAVMRYLALKNSDFHGSDETIRMLKSLLPPQVLAADGEHEPIPAQALAKIAELTQQVQAMQQGGQELMQENQQLKSGAAEAQAKIAVDAKATMNELALKKEAQDAAAKLARDKAIDEFNLKREIAEKEMALADEKHAHDKRLANDKMDFDHKSKLAADPNYKDVAMMPQVMESMQSMAQGIQQAFQQLAELQSQGLTLQQQTLAAIQAQKRTSISGIQRDSGGNIIGATVATSPTVQ